MVADCCEVPESMLLAIGAGRSGSLVRHVFSAEMATLAGRYCRRAVQPAGQVQRGACCYQFWSVRAVPDVADKSAYVVPVAAVMPGNRDAGHAVSSDGEIVLGVFAALETLIQTSRPPLWNCKQMFGCSVGEKSFEFSPVVEVIVDAVLSDE